MFLQSRNLYSEFSSVSSILDYRIQDPYPVYQNTGSKILIQYTGIPDPGSGSSILEYRIQDPYLVDSVRTFNIERQSYKHDVSKGATCRDHLATLLNKTNFCLNDDFSEECLRQGSIAGGALITSPQFLGLCLKKGVN